MFADIPHFYGLVRREYLYNLESHFNEFQPCWVFGIDSIEGRAVGWNILTDEGAMFSRLPICALCWKRTAPIIPLDRLEMWNCFSYNVEAHEFSALRELRCEMKTEGEWWPGIYMFTLGWWGSQWAEQPSEGGFKYAHIIKLENGCYAAQPNNRLRWLEPSFITKEFPKKPDFITNDYIWNVENHTWRTEDSNRYFYETQDDPRGVPGNPHDIP